MIEKPLVKFFEEAFRKHWIRPALCNYDSGTIYSYADVARGVAKVHLLLEASGVTKGDHVALLGEDSAEWCIVWLGVITYGAVLVPILPAFTPEDTMHLVEHSDSKVIFVGPEHVSSLDPKKLKSIRATYRIDTLAPLPECTSVKECRTLDADRLMEERYPAGFRRSDVVYDKVSNSDFVLLSYTSGTSGFSKGVMLTANNLAANINLTHTRNVFRPGQQMLSFLPLAHAYALMFDFLSPITSGAQIYILRYKPTPTILIKALQEVRPQVVLSVPLVLEKIYKSIILKKINAYSHAVKTIIGIPVLNLLVYKRIGKIMIDTMGGRIEQFIVGGAAINDQVEKFVLNTGFPLTVGYGITECAPLISYAPPREHKYSSCGKVLSDVEQVRISPVEGVYQSDSSGHEVGEVQVRGENVCLGYYKNEEATEALFTPDGWMRTGDLGFIDANGYIYLRGRSKAMLLTANGQNIFPEEIESLYGSSPFVIECVVVQRDTKLVAVVVPDLDALKAEGRVKEKEVTEAMNTLRDMINQRLPMYEQVSAVELREEPFEKTPKQSIKRYLIK